MLVARVQRDPSPLRSVVSATLKRIRDQRRGTSCPFSDSFSFLRRLSRAGGKVFEHMNVQVIDDSLGRPRPWFEIQHHVVHAHVLQAAQEIAECRRAKAIAEVNWHRRGRHVADQVDVQRLCERF